MTHEAIRQHLDRRPFAPITVHVADGDLIGLRSPEFAFLPPHRNYLLISNDGSAPAIDRFIDVANITQISTEDGLELARKIY